MCGLFVGISHDKSEIYIVLNKKVGYLTLYLWESISYFKIKEFVAHLKMRFM